MPKSFLRENSVNGDGLSEANKTKAKQILNRMCSLVQDITEMEPLLVWVYPYNVQGQDTQNSLEGMMCRNLSNNKAKTETKTKKKM